MKDFRIEVKIRNNRIFSRIMKRWGSIPLCATCTGLTYASLVDYIGFKLNPILSPNIRYTKAFYTEIKGLPWKNSAVKIADTLGCDVLDLWPDEYFREVRNNRYFFEANKEDMLDLPIVDRKLLTAGSSVLEGFDTANINMVLRTIPERNRRVLELRFGLNGNKPHSLAEIGEVEGLSRERIRQIETKALRLLRHPSRAQRLRIVKRENLNNLTLTQEART